MVLVFWCHNAIVIDMNDVCRRGGLCWCKLCHRMVSSCVLNVAWYCQFMVLIILVDTCVVLKQLRLGNAQVHVQYTSLFSLSVEKNRVNLLQRNTNLVMDKLSRTRGELEVITDKWTRMCNGWWIKITLHFHHAKHVCIVALGHSNRVCSHSNYLSCIGFRSCGNVVKKQIYELKISKHPW